MNDNQQKSKVSEPPAPAPAPAPASAPAPAPASTVQPVADTIYRILGVDDSSTQRKIMEKIFSGDEYDLTLAGSGVDAIKLLVNNDFDVLLLDIEMVGMDGFEICQHIRDELIQVILPIIFVSSHVNKEFIQKALNVGGDEFIVKPLDKGDVLARVNASARQNRMYKRLNNSELVLFSVAHMAEALDTRSGDHCDRLLHMCNVFAEKLALSDDDITTLNYASILHDIGKLAVPDNILTKETPLDEEEWRMMKRHTVIGASLCEHIESCGAVVDIIRHHHETYDGAGYPDGLVGDEIPYLARVFQVVDIYDSMTNNRIYNDAFPRDRVVSIMAKEAQKGVRDAELMQSFLEIVCKTPDLLVRKTMAAKPVSTYKINAMIDSTMKTRNKERLESEEDERR